MSRKKVFMVCPKCGTANLFVKRAAYKVSSHPVYLKKNKLIVNYNKSVYTENREYKFWLRCLKCLYVSREFENEEALTTEIKFRAWDRLRLEPKKPLPKPKETLPVILRAPKPPQLNYDLATNTATVFSL